ncbi:isochorismate synthase, partial [Actinotalea fermentans ATCC 43279 = JCM 9966 = DSM 3133]
PVVAAGAPGETIEEAPLPVARPEGALPGRDDVVFRAAVGRAVSRLEDGVAEKVVLARTLDVSAAGPLDRGVVRAAMRCANPDAYVFDVELPGDQGHLIGASPELLVSVRDGVLHSHPLAGSAPRSADPEEDRATGQRLLTSEKDLREHAFVTAAIREVLRAYVAHEDDLDVPTSPELVATSHLWHLGTPVTARLRPGVSVLDVVYALHPTPAVCGHPQAAARELIGSLEPFDRGFYTGLVGWADQAGNGEWAIVLRCGVVRGADVRLFAGAGVVVGSTPEGEHAETAVKFSTLLSALGVVS